MFTKCKILPPAACAERTDQGKNRQIYSLKPNNADPDQTLHNEATLRVLDMNSEALITLFLGFGAATISLLFWKLSRPQSTNRL